MGYMIPSLAALGVFFATLFFAPLLAAQNNWFQPGILKEPAVAKALQSIDDRSSAIVDEWIHLVEIPAPSGKEQARAEYMRAEMQKLGLADVRVDEMLNVSGVRKGTGGGSESSLLPMPLQPFRKARPSRFGARATPSPNTRPPSPARGSPRN